MSKAIRQIHPFGPPVGKWQSQGTVADTFRRARKQLERDKLRADANAEEAAGKVTPLARAKP